MSGGVKSLRYYLMFGKENKMEQEVKKHEGFGVASLVLSIIALVFSAIALPAWVFMFWLDYLALPLAVLGLIFGIIRQSEKQRRQIAGGHYYVLDCPSFLCDSLSRCLRHFIRCSCSSLRVSYRF